MKLPDYFRVLKRKLNQEKIPSKRKACANRVSAVLADKGPGYNIF